MNILDQEQEKKKKKKKTTKSTNNKAKTNQSQSISNRYFRSNSHIAPFYSSGDSNWQDSTSVHLYSALSYFQRIGKGVTYLQEGLFWFFSFFFLFISRERGGCFEKKI